MRNPLILYHYWYVSKKFRREQRKEFQCPLCEKVGAVEVWLGCSEKGWKQKILTATPPSLRTIILMKSKLIKRSGMVPKACGKRLNELPILPSKMSLKIAKKWKSSLDQLLICQMWKIVSGVNYWLNSDLLSSPGPNPGPNRPPSQIKVK